MKKLFVLCLCSGCFWQVWTTSAANSVLAEQDHDSLRLAQLQEVVVKGVRMLNKAPGAVADIKKAELHEFAKTGQELPFLFSQTPGVMAWSDNGLGTGTSYLRIRGAADSRINVTLDGVPLNSPEDQCVFWANMNSYASLLGSVQIQRGVGSSTNGDAAFGGSVALSSKAPSEIATAELTGSYGSYNTFNVGGSFSTGLLWRHLIIDGAYHETNTDGYVHGTQGRSGSYYGGLTYLTDRFTLRYKNIGNFERTGQAWNGVTAGNNDMSIMDGTYCIPTGIRTYKDMYNAGLGRFNSLYEEFVYNDVNDYSTKRYVMTDGRLWKKTTDNFWQNHNILSAAWNINNHWTATASLHYTHGYGYYDEFRPNKKLGSFGLSVFTDPMGNKVKKSDFVRKKGITQNTYGGLWNVSYTDSRWDVVGGMAMQDFKANHFGYINYVANPYLRQTLLADGEYQYYDSDADKHDYNAFVKATWNVTGGLSLYADAQYRYVRYKTDGYNDKFIDQGDGTYGKHMLDIDETYHFFNPKGGISWRHNGHRLYASVGMSHREPERNNFTDNGHYPAPKAERMLDYEAGYQVGGDRWHLGVNFYYMDYTDQFVQTGAVSDIGEALTTNIKDSYRMGVELTADWTPLSWITLRGNAALSRNKIKDFDEEASVDWDDSYRTIHYDNSTLAYSPSAILNGFIHLHHKGFQAIWHTNFVSKQYLDNTENDARSLPCYSTSSLRLSYSSKVKKAAGLKEVELGLNFNNIFSRRYAAYGWVYSSIIEAYGHPNENRYYQIGFTPSSGFTAMTSLTLRF